MPRTFVVVGHRAATGPDFTVKDLPGSGGRLDVLLRCVNSAFFLSHDLRRDTVLYLVLLGGPDAPKTLRFTGSTLQHLNPDERSTALLVQKALEMKLAGPLWREAHPGIEVSQRGLADLEDALGDKDLVLLDEDGEDVAEARLDPEDDLCLVLSDHEDLTEDERALVDGWGAREVSLGPRALHADHCITLVHGWLDRA